MSALKEAKMKCSDRAVHLVYIWAGVEVLVRIGIWAGFVWFKKVEVFSAWIFGGILGATILEFEVLKISLAAMDEMQEYINQRIEEFESKLE